VTQTDAGVIIKAATAGQSGDGKVFVRNLKVAYWIRNGEYGDDLLVCADCKSDRKSFKKNKSVCIIP
jgi:hypothetical protein